MTRFVWLRQFEPGSNSADANRLLDRLEYLRRLDFPEGLFHNVPAHRITRLRRQGERYFADGLRELPENRRLAILAVCAVEWEMFLADAVVETHDRIVGRTYRTAVRTCEAQLGNETTAVREALRSFADLGSALLGARDAGAALEAVIASRPGWEGLGDLVATAAALANTVASDPLNHVLAGHSRFRRYTPRMLRTLDIEASPVARPLLEAVDVLRNDATARPTGFLRPNSKWSRLLRTQPARLASLVSMPGQARPRSRLPSWCTHSISPARPQPTHADTRPPTPFGMLEVGYWRRPAAERTLLPIRGTSACRASFQPVSIGN